MDKQFQIWQNTTDINLIEKVENNSLKGIDVLDVCQGIVPYSTENLTKEEVKSRIYHSNIKIDENYGVWIQGRVIKRFGIDLSIIEYLKYGAWLHRLRKPKYFNEKNLIQEITGGNPPRISATIYDDTLYHDTGIISCLNVSSLSSEFILAVINSKLMSWYNIKTSPKGKRATFPKVLIGDIRKFPIKNPNPDAESSIIKLVSEIVNLTNSFINFQNTIISFYKNKLDLKVVNNNLLNWELLEAN